jgi:uncharacterized protein YcfJ
MTGRVIGVGLVMLLCAGCVTAPAGPTVMVMPGPDKTFDQFQTDDLVCRHWAVQQAGGAPQVATAQGTATGAGLGTLIGAGLGAAIGAAAGHPGTGAAVGAGGGLLGGTVIGIGAGQSASVARQRRYDGAYEQCMYAKGNDVPREPAPAPAGPRPPR